ncbi:hypothetical protein K1719_012748 [Acacia pycnantha]|nr:hypothetical protein K1719_012748 [Acacia pycnantha]
MPSSLAREGIESSFSSISQEFNLAIPFSSLMPATATIELDGVVRDLSAVTDSDLEKRSLQMKGLNLMDKTFFVEGARISFSIWDVAVRQESGIR